MAILEKNPHKINELCFSLLFIFLSIWGVVTLALDGQPAFTDSMLPDSAGLWNALRGDGAGWGAWLEGTRYRPPLCYLPASLLFWLTDGPSLTLLRLTVLLQYLLLVAVGRSVGRLLVRGDDPLAADEAGLWAALVVGVFPMIFGWGRLAYMDMGLTLAVLVCLRLLLTVDLSRPRSGFVFGVAVGLGALTKLAFALFAIGPLLWMLAFRIRRPRHLLGLGATLGGAGLAGGWWYASQWQMIWINLEMSRGGSFDEEGGAVGALGRGLKLFVWDLPGGPTVLTVALLGGALFWWIGRKNTEKPSIYGKRYLLLVLAILLPMVQLCLFQLFRRYALPLYPLAGVLAGAVVAVAVRRLPRPLVRPVRWALAIGLLASFVALNLGLTPQLPHSVAYAVAGPRVDGLGILSADRRDFSYLERAVTMAKNKGFGRCLLVPNGYFEFERNLAQWDRMLLENRAPMEIESDRRLFTKGELPQRLCVLRVSGRRPERNAWTDFTPQTERGIYNLCRLHAWFDALDLPPPLARWGPSPLGLRYALYVLDGKVLARRTPRVPYCSLTQTGWDEAIHGGADHGEQR